MGARQHKGVKPRYGPDAQPTDITLMVQVGQGKPRTVFNEEVDKRILRSPKPNDRTILLDRMAKALRDHMNS